MVEELINLGKEKTSPPPFRVTQMSEQWAFEYGKGIRQVYDEWKGKGYAFNCPEKLRPYFEGDMSEAEFKTSLHEWYLTTWDKEATAPIKQLSDCETIFNKGVERYLPLQTWGFDIPDTYNVVLTPFAIGGGGAGQRLKGHGPVITMWYGRQYTEGGRSPEEVLLHEAYHLGADEIIKRELGSVISDKSKYQRAKERVVDWCSAEVLVPGVLPIYHYQYSRQPGKPDEHPINAYLKQANLPVPQRLQLYARSFMN